MLKVAVLVLGVSMVCSMKLPSYIEPCSRSDPKLEECAVAHANKALPEVLKGDKAYNLPSLMPLEIPEVKLEPGNNLKINLYKIKIHGFENAIIKKFHFDFEKKHTSIDVDINHLYLESDYEVDGRILVLPITGKGPANITFVGGNYKFDFDYVLDSKRGKQFIRFEKTNLEYKTARSYFRLDNLFNGDKRLGEEMNKFLDESWKEVNDELYPSLKETINIIVKSIASSYFQKISYDEIFLP